MTVDVRQAFVRDLLDIHRKTDGKVDLFLTSREGSEVKQDFMDQGASALEIRASDEEIRRYVEDRLIDLPKKISRDEDLKVKIVEGIISASCGISVH